MRFKMKFAASCKSSNIVYLINCRRCGQQYVGETGQLLHRRINDHWLVLLKNSFVFNNVNYLQVHSTAMGTRMAPSYANLFMGKLEWQFLWTQDKIPRVWWRYIDDIFAAWTHDEPALRAFIQNLNRHHPTIKFTAFWSAKEVTFLNMRVCLRDGLIGTDLHVKPTDTHQYLRMDSCHPHHCKTSIPYCLALLLHRICSEEEHLSKWTREL